MHGPDEVPGVMFSIPSDHTAGCYNTVAHPLKTIQNLKHTKIENHTCESLISNHPCWDTKLCHFLLVTVRLWLVTQFLRQESDLNNYNVIQDLGV